MPNNKTTNKTANKPVLAVTMGDPAGIGPEITVKALLAPEVHAFSRPFVIGDAAILRQALGFCGLSAQLNRIATPAAARYVPGEIDVVDLGVADPARLEVGRVQAAGGAAAFAYICESTEVALTHEADAIVTGPIASEALKLARIPYSDHTEMYADLTGALEEITMFAVGELKIFYLTRHVELIKACRLIKRKLVLAGIEKAMRALHQLSLGQAHLAVASLNPRAGDDGLFGREEIKEIAPAVREACRLGLRVSGPEAADSVFHFARQGRFDAVLALYEDQAHIASKMIDFERTVRVTLGLPIIRTSVDHGTAFEIAGTGKASAVSLVEALRVAARYAGRGVRRDVGTASVMATAAE